MTKINELVQLTVNEYITINYTFHFIKWDTQKYGTKIYN
jgi:hypothetical protein